MTRSSVGQLLERLSAAEALIQQGRAARARAFLGEALSRKVPREHLVRAAYLARRAHWPERAVTLLNPVVRPARPLAPPATDAEKCEYAQSLRLIGATGEAIELLSSVTTRPPEAIAGLVDAYFTQWNWNPAIPLLTRLLSGPALESTRELDARLSLAIAYLHGRGDHETSRNMLEEVVELATRRDQPFWRMNALQLIVQSSVIQADVRRADQDLARLKSDNADIRHPRIGQAIRLWEALAKLCRGKDRRKALTNLRRVRAGFLASGQWELARRCDYYAAVFTDDVGLYRLLYWGTPYPAFRERIANSCERLGALVPAELELRLGGAAREPALLDLRMGASPAKLKPGRAPWLLLRALLSDFYRPQRVPELHERFRPESRFHPIHSRANFHRTLQRLRLELSGARVPIGITERDGAYRVDALKPCRILLPLPERGVPAIPPQVRHPLAMLADAFGKTEFSGAEAASVLGVSKRSALYLLKEGHVSRHGGGRSRRYTLEKG